jgi:hypothetical protein
MVQRFLLSDPLAQHAVQQASPHATLNGEPKILKGGEKKKDQENASRHSSEAFPASDFKNPPMISPNYLDRWSAMARKPLLFLHSVIDSWNRVTKRLLLVIGWVLMYGGCLSERTGVPLLLLCKFSRLGCAGQTI